MGKDGANDLTDTDSKLLKHLKKLAKDRLKGKTLELTNDFLAHYFDGVPEAELELLDPEQLFTIALNHSRFAAQRSAGEFRLRVYTPQEEEHGWSAPVSVVETVAPDMPFLVDTVSMAINEQGYGIGWFAHPVLKLSRDKKGKLVAAQGPAQEAKGEPESLIHMQFDPLPDEAARNELEQELKHRLTALRVVVEDWHPMQAQVEAVIEELNQVPQGFDADEFEEAQAFLRWLLDAHFTFLGYRQTEVKTNKRGRDVLRPTGEGLGLFNPELPEEPEGYVAPAEQLDKYAQSPRLLVVTQSNSMSPVHHPEYMDVVSLKRFNAKGRVVSTHRFLGLFSTEVYSESPRLIPLLRRKVAQVMERSGLREGSHVAKNLRQILETLPRDELFQSSEDELYETAMGVLSLRQRRRLRLFVRRDRYGRFFSCLIYLPRERYNQEIRERIMAELHKTCGAQDLEADVRFTRGETLARIHCMVQVEPGSELDFDVEALEKRLQELTRSWKDQLREVLTETGAERPLKQWGAYADAFPVAYSHTVEPGAAAADLEYLVGLTESEPLAVQLQQGDADDEYALSVKLYVLGECVALSDVLPTLENFGLHVYSQQPYEIEPTDQTNRWVQVFTVRSKGEAGDLSELKPRFEEAFLRTWRGEAENDGFNRLIAAAGLTWRQTALLRALCKYLLQTGLPYSQNYIEGIMADQSAISRLLAELFEARFDPDAAEKQRKQAQDEIGGEIDVLLDKVQSLDSDRVLRAARDVIRAAWRTNFYQPDAQGRIKPYISLKLNPAKIPELPKPLPMFETWVYSPQVEGVHLRGGEVARGGLRWSDRREDFRTEVLGLMKAQMVKNAVIVPVGAKGGFVVKAEPPTPDREARQKLGIACYKTFIRGLLDITDNLVEDEIAAPDKVVRYDGDDPYLVVAADKGTASFSDIANGLSEEYGFWLGDAFASGGSAGYDHKEMGITAKGAWESVKRHFREMAQDTQKDDFTVVGIGDMGGDVFGNGMLLSRHIKLIAAFNHLHIFIDPNPDPEKSYAERERLFKAEASGWDAYDKRRISKGGGVWARSEKSIELSHPAREALGIQSTAMTPTELIHEILRAPADLLWNGGIGTYVKASGQAHIEVGDRANDALRVDGRDLRCKVIGEGGNLGLTQPGRIEAALHGVRLNTDAIDNSGGVDSSDREVNIKIPLNKLLIAGKLKLDARNKLLESMTDDVARMVLRDNYLQSQIISVHEQRGVARLDEHAHLIRMLERRGQLDRAIEFLPDEETIAERANNNLGLTRPEIAVLVSYSKIVLYSEVLVSELPDDPYFEPLLLEGFPEAVRRAHPEALKHHRLRREIIATILTNIVVNRMGMAFAHRWAEEHGVSAADIVHAYFGAADVGQALDLWRGIERLDHKISADHQYRLFGRVIGLLKHLTLWLVTSAYRHAGLGEVVPRFQPVVAELAEQLPQLMTGAYLEEWQEIAERHQAEGVPEEIAGRIATTHALGCALDLCELSEQSGLPVTEVAETYFVLGDKFLVPWLLRAIIDTKVLGRWQALARSTLRDDTYRVHRALTAQALEHEAKDARGRAAAWMRSNAEAAKFALERLRDLHSRDEPDFMELSVAVRELRDLSEHKAPEMGRERRGEG